jgi:hypothetical protein
MPAILRQHVHYAAKADDGDALLRPGQLLSAEAAAEFGISSERVRQLCRRQVAASGRIDCALILSIARGSRLTSPGRGGGGEFPVENCNWERIA